MATQTTNLHLTKPDGTEKVNIATINTNMDTIDTYAGTNNASIINLAEDIGVVVNGNKTKSGVTAAVGQYVVLKNSTISNRVDGLYTAAKAIPANTAIDASYLTAVSGGGLNALNAKFPTKVDKTNMTDGESYTYTSQSAMESGLVSLATTVMGANKVRTIFLYPNFTSQIFGGAAGCATISTGGSSSYFTVLFHNYVTAVHGTYLNGTWSWERLALKSDLLEVGTIKAGANNSASVSVADGTGVELNSVTVDEAGTYLLIGAADWATNGNGYRQLAFADAINPGRNIATTTMAIDGKETFQQVIQIVATTGRTTYKIYGRQTSGNTINCYPYLVAIRI